MIIDDVLPLNYQVVTHTFVRSVLKLASGFIMQGKPGCVMAPNLKFRVMICSNIWIYVQLEEFNICQMCLKYYRYSKAHMDNRSGGCKRCIRLILSSIGPSLLVS